VFGYCPVEALSLFADSKATVIIGAWELDRSVRSITNGALIE
jgi:hypothetical protein